MSAWTQTRSPVTKPFKWSIAKKVHTKKRQTKWQWSKAEILKAKIFHRLSICSAIFQGLRCPRRIFESLQSIIFIFWQKPQNTHGISLSHSVCVWGMKVNFLCAQVYSWQWLELSSLQHQCQNCLPWVDVQLGHECLMDGWMANKLGNWLSADKTQNNMGLI